jgi:hypothetical protein
VTALERAYVSQIVTSQINDEISTRQLVIAATAKLCSIVSMIDSPTPEEIIMPRKNTEREI